MANLKVLLIDESKAKQFLLCVVEIDTRHLNKAKKVVKNTRKKGQSTVHFVSERASRKKEILSNYRDIDFRCKIFISANKKEIPARATCLKALIESLDEKESYSIILDRDETNVARDRVVFFENLRKKRFSKDVEYKHHEPSQENLLWIPDAIAWTVAKGGSWKPLLASFNISKQSVD